MASEPVTKDAIAPDVSQLERILKGIPVGELSLDATFPIRNAIVYSVPSTVKITHEGNDRYLDEDQAIQRLTPAINSSGFEVSRWNPLDFYASLSSTIVMLEQAQNNAKPKIPAWIGQYKQSREEIIRLVNKFENWFEDRHLYERLDDVVNDYETGRELNPDAVTEIYNQFQRMRREVNSKVKEQLKTENELIDLNSPFVKSAVAEATTTVETQIGNLVSGLYGAVAGFERKIQELVTMEATILGQSPIFLYKSTGKDSQGKETGLYRLLIPKVD